MNEIKSSDWTAILQSVARVMTDNADHLCEMDARMGDGDLGLTMSKGYAALPDLMRAEAAGAAGDVGKMLMKAGMKMSSLVPSTMGFLMSTGVMEGGKALKGKTELDGAALADYLVGFAAGVQKRGKCELGDRTILDSVNAGAEKAAALVASNPDATFEQVISAAVEGADEGVEATKDMLPKFGKAAVHAAKAKGVADQGALAGYYMLLGLKNYFCA